MRIRGWVFAASAMPPRVRQPHTPCFRDAMEAVIKWESWRNQPNDRTDENRVKFTDIAVTPPDQIIRPYTSTPASTPSSVRLSPGTMWVDPIVSSLQPTLPSRKRDSSTVMQPWEIQHSDATPNESMHDGVSFVFGELTQAPCKRGRVN